jgi:hypothetical protein
MGLRGRKCCTHFQSLWECFPLTTPTQQTHCLYESTSISTSI